MKKTHGTALVAFLATLATACGDSPLGLTEWIELGQARERWTRRIFHDYRFEIRRLCFCSAEYTLWSIVQVRSDTLAAVRLLPDSIPLPQSRFAEWPTIEMLFDQIRHTDGGVYEDVTVTYDDVLGYPVVIDFYPRVGVYDAGAHYELRNVGALP